VSPLYVADLGHPIIGRKRMPFQLQILAVSISFVALVVILELVRRGQLREEYSLLWLAAVVVLLALSVHRGALHAVAGLLGVAYAPSLLFAVAFLFNVIILVSQSVYISALTCKNRDLAQRLAILEYALGQDAHPANPDRSNAAPNASTRSQEWLSEGEGADTRE
jgi:hypothetical protein